MNKAPVFQHRHYKAIAALIAGLDFDHEYGDPFNKSDLLEPLVALLASDNPRFDEERFLAAASGKPSNGRDKVRS